jgi:IMP dehydrogenase
MNTYTFNDVLIQPAYSEIRSRKDVDLSVNLYNQKIEVPVISANMKTVTGPRMAKEMMLRGAWSILHRFNSIEEAVEEFKEVGNTGIGVSIGVNGDSKERFKELYNAGARYFCVDVAHGHHVLMKETIEYIKSEYPNIYVIGGNIATTGGASDLVGWGANAVKIGIGPGSMCQTRTNTGVGVPQLWAFEEIHRVLSDRDDVILIGDGGIKTIGDMAKSFKFVDLLMLGSYFAGSMETPGNVYKRKDGSRYKIYGGSASAHNKNDGRRKPEFVEGVTEEVPLGDHVKFLLKEIKEGIQSACSYVGAENMVEYKTLCKFLHISGGGKTESKFNATK